MTFDANTTLAIGVMFGQLAANITIVWRMLRSHGDKIEELLQILDAHSVQLHVIGDYYASRDKQFSNIWQNVKKLNGHRGGVL